MNTTTTQWPGAISEQKRNALIQLIYSNIQSDALEKWLDFLESASEEDADELLENLSKPHFEP